MGDDRNEKTKIHPVSAFKGFLACFVIVAVLVFAHAFLEQRKALGELRKESDEALERLRSDLEDLERALGKRVARDEMDLHKVWFGTHRHLLIDGEMQTERPTIREEERK